MRIRPIRVIRLQYRLMVIIVIVLSLVLWMGLIRLGEVLVMMIFWGNGIFASSISVVVSRNWILCFIMLVVIIRIANILDRVGRLRRQSVALSHRHLYGRLLRSVWSVFELVAMERVAWRRRPTSMARIHGVTAVLFVFWILFQESAFEGSGYVVCQ